MTFHGPSALHQRAVTQRNFRWGFSAHPAILSGVWLVLKSVFMKLRSSPDDVLRVHIASLARRRHLVPSLFHRQSSGSYSPLVSAIIVDRARIVTLHVHALRVLYPVSLLRIATLSFLPTMRILSLGENVRYASVPIVSWLAVGVVINPLVR